MTPSKQQRVEMSRILHLLAKLPLLCRIFQSLGSLLWSLLPTQRRFCRQGLPLLMLLLLSDGFFSLHLWVRLPGAGSQLPHRGGGFIFLVIWLRSLPAVSRVISGARLCLVAKTPQAQSPSFVLKYIYFPVLKGPMINMLSNLPRTRC